MKKDPRVYLVHIVERIDRILEYTKVGRDSFFGDARTQDAVLRNLEVIGEAAKQVPPEYRAQYSLIPWRSLAALRDVIIHQYEGVSLAEVWNVVEKNLPDLRKAVADILPPADQIERDIAGDSST